MSRPDFKHREATYQQLCAQVLREARDLPALAASAGRALSHPDVSRDPVLEAMLRSFVAEQQALLAAQRPKSPEEQAAETSKLEKPFEVRASCEAPTRAQIIKGLRELQHEFESHAAEYDESAAEYSLGKIRELGERYPVYVEATLVRRYEERFAQLTSHCALYRLQLEGVARQAVRAAAEGDAKTANWLFRRLRAIHALTPSLLPAFRFEQLRSEMERSESHHEHREALRGLIERERSVADTIKRAGAAIYRFHEVSRTTPPGSDEYARAEHAYRTAVNEVRALDTEWLTGLLLELESYLGDLEDPEQRAQAQLDRFIGTVRNALTKLRHEIRAIQDERRRTSDSGSFPTTRPARPETPAPDSYGEKAS